MNAGILENCLYRATALTQLLYGEGLKNFIGCGTKVQDGVLWLLHEELRRANDAFQEPDREVSGARQVTP